MKKVLIAVAILIAVGCMLPAPLTPLLSANSGGPAIEVASMPVDSSSVAQKRLLAVFETQKIPFTLSIDPARIAHFHVRSKHLKKARMALVREQQNGLKVIILTYPNQNL